MPQCSTPCYWYAELLSRELQCWLGCLWIDLALMHLECCLQAPIEDFFFFLLLLLFHSSYFFPLFLCLKPTTRVSDWCCCEPSVICAATWAPGTGRSRAYTSAGEVLCYLFSDRMHTSCASCRLCWCMLHFFVTSAGQISCCLLPDKMHTCCTSQAVATHRDSQYDASQLQSLNNDMETKCATALQSSTCSSSIYGLSRFGKHLADAVVAGFISLSLFKFC